MKALFKAHAHAHKNHFGSQNFEKVRPFSPHFTISSKVTLSVERMVFNCARDFTTA